MELIDVLDENGNPTGQVESRKVVHEKGLWHTHVGVWIMNKKGELLFQQRSPNKKVNPYKWTRTGGHVDSGETPLQAIQRETEEEIGVKIPLEDFEHVSTSKTVKDSLKVNRNFIYSYFAVVDYKLEDYKMQEEEVCNLRYITIEEMKKAIKENDTRYTFVSWDNCDEIISLLEEKRDSL